MAIDVLAVLGGGTGSSTAATARTALGVDITTTTGLAKLPRGWLSGLQLTAVSTNTITISAGVCRSADDTANYVLVAAISKNMGSAFAVGSGNGGRFVSIPASGTFHIFAITRDSDGLSDIGGDTSLTGASVPSGWTVRRRLMSFRSNGSSNLIAMTQLGDEFLITTPTPMTTYTLETSGTLTDINTPAGIKVRAIGDMYLNSTSAVYLSAPDQTNGTPSQSAAPLVTQSSPAATYTVAAGIMIIRTDTSSRIRFRGLAATGTALYCLLGWIDTRGRDD